MTRTPEQFARGALSSIESNGEVCVSAELLWFRDANRACCGASDLNKQLEPHGRGSETLDSRVLYTAKCEREARKCGTD